MPPAPAHDGQARSISWIFFGVSALALTSISVGTLRSTVQARACSPSDDRQARRLVVRLQPARLARRRRRRSRPRARGPRRPCPAPRGCAPRRPAPRRRRARPSRPRDRARAPARARRAPRATTRPSIAAVAARPATSSRGRRRRERALAQQERGALARPPRPRPCPVACSRAARGEKARREIVEVGRVEARDLGARRLDRGRLQLAEPREREETQLHDLRPLARELRVLLLEPVEPARARARSRAAR